MTTRHIVEGLMRTLRMRTHQQCEVHLGLSGGTFSRMCSKPRHGLTVALLDRIQARSGVSFEQLMTWFREQEPEAEQDHFARERQ